MYVNKLALIGALVLLPIAFGHFQPLGFPPDHVYGFPPANQHGHCFPAVQHHDFPAIHHDFPRTGPHPVSPPHHGLRHRRMANETADWDMIPTTAPPPTDPSITPRIDCGESPLVKQKTGCPCFTLETITTQFMDLKKSQYCSLWATKPVDESDPCSHLYPRYAYFDASTGTDTETFGIYFQVSGNNYDPESEGGYCSGGVFDYISNYDQTGGSGEVHQYDIGFELDKERLLACEKILQHDLKKELEAIPNCVVEDPGTYYY